MSNSVKPESASSAIPNGVYVLTVNQVARRLGVTARHVITLIETGELVAFDVSGRSGEYQLVPASALKQLAARLKVTPEQLTEFIRGFKSTSQLGRNFYRIPVAEGLNSFLAKRRSVKIAEYGK